MKTEPGTRVGAILSADSQTVYLLGYGVYNGDHKPDNEEMANIFGVNPKITLDDGRVVWGYQCWWSPEEETKEFIGNRKVVNASVEKAA